jgi:signal transduction histidine kinase
MRLADFIVANSEPIQAEWEIFARGIWPGAPGDQVALRDHAADILRATVRDMRSPQDPQQRLDKSRGKDADTEDSIAVDGASELHAANRVASGFDLRALVAEYRALRASVLRLWGESHPAPDSHDMDDLTRFNESIDQSLARAVDSFTERIDRSRQMFLAILGHDLRNPLNATSMLAAQLSRPGKLDAESSLLASRIAASSHAMGKMISDLLDFTAAGLGGKMPIAPAPMDLGELAQEVVDETLAAFPARVLGFEKQGDLAGTWDPARLRQVLSNLLGNAIQHGLGSVGVALTDQGDEVRMTVRNGGTLIPAESLPTIFEPLAYRSPELQKYRRPGSIGLGLFIAHEIVTAHGGDILVTSTSEDGTLFTVRLPRWPRPEPLQ